MSENEQDNNANEEQQPPQEVAVEPPYAVEETPDVYPLRPAAQDPRWALWVVYIWSSIAVFLILFLVTLLILGIWYD